MCVHTKELRLQAMSDIECNRPCNNADLFSVPHQRSPQLDKADRERVSGGTYPRTRYLRVSNRPYHVLASLQIKHIAMPFAVYVCGIPIARAFTHTHALFHGSRIEIHKYNVCQGK